ncbi:MAG TPA: hypothetical protein VMV94_13310 [Phycisphaerae bacterium]|nr:hypothetical protein [Phycisphaerae bacterium]
MTPPWTPDRARSWYGALFVSFLLLVATGFLLGRLIWLPFYFGLFFFLVAGLLAGALSFRIARQARPVSQGRIVRGICLVAVVAAVVTLGWEYEHVAKTIGDGKFADARNRAAKAGRPQAEIRDGATGGFKAALAKTYPPGGFVGYVRWAMKSGEMAMEVGGCRDTVAISQSGYAWLLRTLIGAVLLGAGLWASFESLRSAQPVSNILAPGEEYEEE